MHPYSEIVSNKVPGKREHHLLLLLQHMDERTHPQRRGDLRKLYCIYHIENSNKVRSHPEIQVLDR